MTREKPIHPTLPSRAREHMFPGATTLVRESVSNVKPALMVRSPVAVLRGVSPGLVRSRVGGASHKQNSRNSKHDFPAHDQLLCSVAILVCSTYATPLHIRCELDHAGVPCRTRDDLSQCLRPRVG
jgi:hypothetical protein